MAALLRVDGVSKTYPGVIALNDVSFEVEAGTVHAVVGENGAGKSTLMQVIAGAQRPSSGRLLLRGEELQLAGTRDANHHGIAIVFQEIVLAPNMTIAENIYLGQEPRTLGAFVDRRVLRLKATEAMSRLGVVMDPDTKLGALTIAQQQLVEISRALVHDPELLILDEPTSSLSEAETLVLFRVIRDLRQRGVTMLYISHRMREIFDLCDGVTVLRDGRHVRTTKLEDTSPDEVVRMMVGRDLAEVKRVAPPQNRCAVALSVRGLSDDENYRDVSFDLHEGEIVGLAGLIGAGRSEVAMGIFGAPPPKRGTVSLYGREISVAKPREAIRLGIGVVPEDRKSQGLFLGMGVGPNLSLAALSLGGLSRLGFVRAGAEAHLIAGYVKRLRIKTPTIEQLVGLLSGGNQQKVVLAKWLAANPRVLIVDEPTRGVDVGAKAEIYALMRELAREGLAILVISSDLPEILTISDRILVMRASRLAGEISFEEASEERIMALAALEHGHTRGVKGLGAGVHVA